MFPPLQYYHLANANHLKLVKPVTCRQIEIVVKLSFSAFWECCVYQARTPARRRYRTWSTPWTRFLTPSGSRSHVYGHVALYIDVFTWKGRVAYDTWIGHAAWSRGLSQGMATWIVMKHSQEFARPSGRIKWLGHVASSCGMATCRFLWYGHVAWSCGNAHRKVMWHDHRERGHVG
jgi:hypothetical protein